MAKCCRHFKALMRKNWIVWYRNPGCAAFEVLAPCILMAVLWIIRLQVPTVPVDREGMLTKKYPMYIGGQPYDIPEGFRYKNHWVDDHMRGMGYYADYSNTYMKDSSDFNAGIDMYGPEFFTPGQCLQITDYSHPKVASPWIGIIGNETEYTDYIIDYMKYLTGTQHDTLAFAVTPNYRKKHFDTVEEFESYISAPDYKSGLLKNQGICFGLQDVSNPNDTDDYSFEFHFPDKAINPFNPANKDQAVPNQQNPIWSPYASAPDVWSYIRYQHQGFGQLQNLLALAILSKEKNDLNSFIGVFYQPMETETTITDPLQSALGILLPLFILLGFIPPVYNITFKIVREKETRMKETMRIMGMTDLPYWLSWFIFYTLMNTIITTMAWGFLLPSVIHYSNKGYMWLFFWLYGEAIFGQIIFLQSMFSGSKYAGIVSTIIYFCGVLVDSVIKDGDVTKTQKILASLLPQVALMQGSAVFANYEGTGVGINNDTAQIEYENFSFNLSLYMMAADFAIFFVLGFYLDKVLPSEYGQRLNPCFCILPSYWRRTNRRNPNQLDEDNLDEKLINDDDNTFETQQMPIENYEAPPLICKRLEATGDYLQIDNLQKTFSGGFRAVKGVNMKMYDSQIYALLGHNGAGKSTVISMLTGLIGKSTGSARVYDVDLFESKDEVREFMGVCPQHDVLFDDLNPREHIELFYDFKGGDPARKKQETETLIEDSGLSIDQHKTASTLSGGNRRKTSVCVALCGGSRLVLLDEPTAGMDLGARRNLWDMLKLHKKDKIIILTTHYMDEADVLGDRIGIMVRGELKCIGSPLFLKNRFGIGYKITLVKKQKKVHKDLERFLKSYFKGVQQTGEVHDEITFVIPKEESSNFGGFFQALDERLDEFEVKSYGVSMSNLEDVFLKINQEFAPELFGGLKGFGGRQVKMLANDSHNSYRQNAIANSTGPSQDLSEDSNSDNEITNEFSGTKTLDDSGGGDYEMEDDGVNLIRGSSTIRSCTASAAKRVIIYKRDWCGLLCQVIIPIVLVLFGLWLQSKPSKLTQSPPRAISTEYYPYKQRMIMNEMPVNQTGVNDATGLEIAQAFPNYTDAFEVTKFTKNMSYMDFYDEVYAARNEGANYPYRYGSFNIYTAQKDLNDYQAIMYLNITSQETAGAFPQFLYNAILRVALDKPNLKFNVVNRPFPIYQKFKDLEAAAGAFDFVFMVAIALALVPCVMVQFILNERASRLKHQQLLSGMSLIGYWMSNLCFDIIMSYIPIGLIIALTFAFDTGFEGIWVLLLLYPPAVVPFTYVTSFLFNSDINAQIVTLFIHFVAGGLLAVVVFALQQLPVTMVAGDALRWVSMIIPSFCVTYGIMFSASGKLIVNARVVPETDDNVPIPFPWPSDIWDWYNLKADAVCLIAHFVFGLIVLFLIEIEIDQLFRWIPRVGLVSCNRRQRLGPVLVKDDDVIQEEKRVQNMGNDRATFLESRDSNADGQARADGPKMDCIRVNNFSKQYESLTTLPVMAVREASFALDYGECFGLLGVNGAGKSTTFKSLTREITPTTGEITIQGLDVQTEFSEARNLIGYCPQFDAIFPVLTVEETLKFYALIKGIRTHKIPGVVRKAIKQLNLTDHVNKLAGTLSGGNKRKLSVAMALMGNPPIILLDEPSAGMDPEARRFMWQVVEKISQRNKSSAVILTTHSMEEAEALSTKLGIMVRGGVFRCMGSTQHIKNKFGVGYEVEIKVKKTQEAGLQEMARQYGFSDNLKTKVVLEDAIQQLRSSQFDQLILNQIRLEGLGHDLQYEADIDDQASVRLRNLILYLRAQLYGFGIVKYLTQNFDRVEMLEQCGEYFKLRVPMEGSTIGWLFGQLEQQKEALGIQEYSVQQTSLEQIFQSFANQSIASDKRAFTFVLEGDDLVLLNPRRETIALAASGHDQPELRAELGLGSQQQRPSAAQNQAGDDDSRLLSAAQARDREPSTRFHTAAEYSQDDDMRSRLLPQAPVEEFKDGQADAHGSSSYKDQDSD